MLIKDTTNLKVGDFLRITSIGGHFTYRYRVRKIVDHFHFEYDAIEFKMDRLGKFNLDNTHSNTYLMTEEEVSLYLLGL